MIPESRLIRSELTIRELSLPSDVLLARKSLVRWLALSLGLILPNESRQLLLDLLDVILEFHIKKQNPTTKDILTRLGSVTKEPPNPKTVYYHLQRLKDFGILIRKKGRYYLGDDESESLRDVFRRCYLKRADKAFENISFALDKLEGSYV